MKSGVELSMRTISSLLVLFLLLPALPAAAEADTAGTILQELRAGRRQAGAAPLIRRAGLDGVAAARAERIAGMSHDKRLALGESIETGLNEAGITGFRSAAVHLDMVRGYTDPAAGFLKSWRGYASAWSRALDPRYDQVGIATHAADDGWIILVAILLEEMPEPGDPRELESRTIEAINEIRRERGLPELTSSAGLAAVALAHSEDMARRGFFGHVSPDGLQARDRVAAAGISYSALAENIQRNHRFDDPVRQAVESWMLSAGHKKNILEPIYSETGVGVAIDEEGKIHFTQLFMRPAGE
jgi:uncharacterized protein YkwD